MEEDRLNEDSFYKENGKLKRLKRHLFS